MPRGNGAAGVNRVKAPSEEERTKATEILQFLNDKAGRSFKPTDVNLHFIMARMREGYTPEECRQVIAMKTREWKNGEQSKFLRPATLFNATMFNQYAGFLDDK